LGLIGLMFVLMAVPAAVAQGNAKIDINNATEKQLVDLPGVGKATAGKIIAGRPYASVDDLVKAGVSKSAIAKIAPLVTVGAASAAARLAPAAPIAKPVAPAAASVTKAAPETLTAYTPPPAAGMVWINLGTNVYHKEGDRWYGKTESGNLLEQGFSFLKGMKS
jgi:hypothetical protein